LQNKGLNKKHILLLIAFYCAFIVYAFYHNGFGINAPVMMEYYGISSAQQGFILTMQAIGALSVSIYLGLQGERFNKINVASFSLLAASFAAVAIGFAPSYITLLFLVVVTGAGYTSLDLMANSLISEIFPKQKNTLLPLLHAFFGSGAMVTPILVAMFVNPEMPSSFTRAFTFAGVMAVVMVIFLLIAGRRVLPETPYANMDNNKKRASENPAEVFKEKKAWLILAASFFYFTFQIGIVSWLPSYCLEIGMDFITSGTMLTVYLAGSLIMRFCGPLFLKRMTVEKAYILFSILSAVIVTAALFMTVPFAMAPLLITGGFLQGSCVACLFLMANGAFPHRTASASSLVMIAINIGAMTSPLWIGFIAEYTGFRIPLLLICASLALSVVMVLLLKGKDSELTDK